jgi:hypothetical protein
LTPRPEPDALSALVAERLALPVSPILSALGEHLAERHGERLAALLFYGSCLRSGDEFDGLVDLYLLVDRYRDFHRHWLPALFNRLLPPNVYYLEQPLPHAGGQRTLRVKLSILSLADLERGAGRWFHSYIWGRFAQPSALVRVRDEAARRRVVAALTDAVATFVRRTLPRLPEELDAASLWQTGLSLSYGCELRSEGAARARQLFESDPSYYSALTVAAMERMPYSIEARPGSDRFMARIPASHRRLNRLGWMVRRRQGKLLSLLRLIKGLFTFQGGLDYILWKIERHSGVRVEVPALARRHPLLAGWGVLWRLYRRGAFR